MTRGRHTWSLVAAAALLVSVGLLRVAAVWPQGDAPPTVAEDAERVAIRNNHYVAVVSRSAGGMLDSVRCLRGEVLAGPQRIYTDRGIFGENVDVTSRNEANAWISIARGDGRVTVRSEGRLLRADSQVPAQGEIRYWVEYGFDASRVIHTRWGAIPQFDTAEVSGFFAYLIATPEYTDWFANTVDGTILQEASRSNRRCFESRVRPLSAEAGGLGYVTPGGNVVAFAPVQQAPPFANVFFHEGESRSIAVFFAWLDGPSREVLTAGQEWRGGVNMTVAQTYEELLAPSYGP